MRVLLIILKQQQICHLLSNMPPTCKLGAAQRTGSVASAYPTQAKEIRQIMSSLPNDKRGQLLLDLQAELDAVDQAETDDVEVEIDGVEISAETGAVNQAETDAVEVETDAVFHSAETDDVEAETDSVERLDDAMPPTSTSERPIASGYSGMGHGPRRMRGLGGGCHKRIPKSIPKRTGQGSRLLELRASLRAPSAPVEKDPIPGEEPEEGKEGQGEGRRLSAKQDAEFWTTMGILGFGSGGSENTAPCKRGREELRASLRAPSAPVEKDPIRTIAEMHQAIACTGSGWTRMKTIAGMQGLDHERINTCLLQLPEWNGKLFTKEPDWTRLLKALKEARQAIEVERGRPISPLMDVEVKWII